MRWPRIGIVIAAYGRTDTLRLAVESALRQHYPDFQILIVVDGNPEQFAELCELYRGADRIAVHDLARNTGEQSGPNNVGVALCDAELIAFLNHDDLWFPDHLRVLAETLLARRADIAFSQAAGVSPDSGPIARAEDCGFYLMSRLPGGRYRPFYSWVGVSSSLVRKAAFERIGGFRRALDCLVEPSQDFLIRARRAGLAFAYADEITLLAIHSGIRRGSYRSDYDSREQKILAAQLFEQGPAALRAIIIPRLGPDGRAGILDRIVQWTGFPVNLFALRRHGLRRGRLLDRLRETRGLGPLARPAASVAAFVRRHQAAIVPRAVRGTTEWISDDLQPVFGEGWYQPEPWGRWAAGRSAVLRFGVAGETGDRIRIAIACVFPAGSVQLISARTQTSRRVWRGLRLRPDEISRTVLVVHHRMAAPEEMVEVAMTGLFRFGPGAGSTDRRRFGLGVGGVTVLFAPRVAVGSPPP